jgi:hypothetical protein
MLARYTSLAVLVLLFAGLYFTGRYDYDLGDYRSQTEDLLQYNRFQTRDSVSNRYPPVTSLVYYGFIKATSPAPFSKTILLIHFILAVGIQLQFNHLLAKLGYNKEKNGLKNLLRSVVILNPFILSFIMRGANSELIFINFALGILLLLLQFRKKQQSSQLLFLGLLMGLSILTRTQSYALFIATIFILFRYHVRLGFLTFLLPMVLLITPWQSFNASFSTSFISSGLTPSFRDGLSFNNKPHRTPISLPASVDTLSRKFYELYYIQQEDLSIPQPKTEKEWVSDYLVEHPKTALDLALLKFIRCFYGTDAQNPLYETINKWLIGTIMALFLLSLWYIRKTAVWDTDYIQWMFIVCILNVGMSMMALSILRYQAPLLPYLFVIILLAIDRKFRLGRSIS